MTKLTFLSAVVIAAIPTLAGPVAAQQKVLHSAQVYAQGWCPNREPGNPYTKEEDYTAWSAWRARGGWDDHNDFDCLRDHRHAAGF